jgi:hypothetical protein
VAYVKPLCDDTCLRSARPICASFSDGFCLRHSDSSSCIQVSTRSIRAGPSETRRVSRAAGARRTYLNVQVLVDFDSIAEDVDVLGQIGKLPHVAQLLQCAGVLGRLVRVHFARGALACGHIEGARRGRRVGRWRDCGVLQLQRMESARRAGDGV